ncbi:MAG TPA: prolipoprotein diacylglyceryl transferase [Rickettsiales bacterium]|nr:prolipoprotein diacylglyceryl transferase [Rickettsiales bacterium]
MQQIIYLPIFNPVALQIGPLAVRWYSLAYIAGILAAMFFINHQNKKHNFMSQKAQDDWLMWAVFSIILGGRLGYVLFYNIQYFLSNPLEIFAIWQGGMSFHGGLLGSILGLWLFCRTHKVNFLQIADIIAIIAPLGIFFGRMANFINLELYGRPTNGDFGMIFPSDPLGLPRHPSQLYEGFFEGLFICILLLLLSKFTKIQNRRGALSALFLILYGFSRIIIENFREPDAHIGFIFQYITMGQILSLPLILLGLTMLIWQRK